MKEKLEKKRDELMAEFGRGQQAMQAIQKQASDLTASMHRIQGAIQLCTEQIDELAPKPPKKGAKKGLKPVKNDPE